MRCWTTSLMSELIIALVDTPSVFVIGMPHLTAVPATTLGTLNFGRKYRHTAVPWTSLASSLYFWLHQVEEFRFNDCRVVVFYIILWNFPFIGFDLLSKEINCIRLLQQGITFVLLIRKNNPSIVYLILYFFDKLIGSFSFIIAIAFMWYISLLCYKNTTSTISCQ